MTIRQYLRFVVVGVIFYGFFLPWDENHYFSPPFGSEYFVDFFAGIVARRTSKKLNLFRSLKTCQRVIKGSLGEKLPSYEVLKMQ